MGIFNSIYKSGLGFWNFLFNRELPVREVTPLGDVEDDKIKKKLSAQVQSLTSQLGDYKAQEREDEEEEKDKDIQDELIKKLNKKQEVINNKQVGPTFSWGKFLQKSKKFKKYASIDITDKDDENVIGNFEDLIVIGNNFAITDTEGNIVVSGKTINDIVWKPESLNNHIKRGRIPIPYDSKGDFIADLENLHMPEMIYDQETDKFEEAQEFMRPVKEMIKDRDREIMRLQKYTERNELRLTKVTRENNDLKRTNHILEVRSDAANTELSKVLDKTTEYDKKVGELHRKIVSSSEMNTMKDVMVERLEKVNSDLLAKVERFGVSTDFEKTTAYLQDIIEWAKQVTPEQIIEYRDKDQEESINTSTKIPNPI